MSEFRNRSPSPPPSRPVDRTGTTSSTSSKNRDREEPEGQIGFLKWAAGRIGGRRDRVDEMRRPKQSDRPKHRRSRRPSHRLTNPVNREYPKRDSNYPTRPGSESDDDSSQISSSSADSRNSAPSDNLSSRLYEMATRTKDEDDIILLQEAGKHIHNKDREMRNAVTTIAKMHRADNQKRDDRSFIQQTKTLRYMVENWSKTQKTINISSPADAKANFTRLFNALSLSSTNVKILKSIGSNYTQYLVTAGDVSKLLQAYLWAVLEQEVFGRFRWLGFPNAFVDLKAIVFPSECDYPVPARLYTLML